MTLMHCLTCSQGCQPKMLNLKAREYICDCVSCINYGQNCSKQGGFDEVMKFS